MSPSHPGKITRRLPTKLTKAQRARQLLSKIPLLEEELKSLSGASARRTKVNMPGSSS